MRSDARQPEDEDLPARPSPWSFSMIVNAVSRVLVGGAAGWIVGSLAVVVVFDQGAVVLLGVIVGAMIGLYFGTRHVHRVIGKGKRTSDERLPGLKPGVGLSTHIMVLRDALATAPAKRVKAIEAHNGRVVSVAISPDAKSLITAGDDRTVTLWDLATGFEIGELGAMPGGVSGVAFSPDGRLAAACGMDRLLRGGHPGLVRVWDTESGRELRRFETENQLFCLAFSPDGQALHFGGAGYLRAWDLESAELVMLLNIRTGLIANDDVLCVAASPDGRYVLCGTGSSQDARLIDLQRGDCERKYTGHRAWFQVMKPASVTSVHFAPDGRRVLTGSVDQTARVWDIDSGNQLACFRGHVGTWGWRGVVAVAFHPDGKRALSASKDGTVRLWDATTGKEIRRYDHGARVWCMAVSRDGKLAVSGGRDGVVRVWELPAS